MTPEIVFDLRASEKRKLYNSMISTMKYIYRIHLKNTYIFYEDQRMLGISRYGVLRTGKVFQNCQKLH